jgi:hypothetical protein
MAFFRQDPEQGADCGVGRPVLEIGGDLRRGRSAAAVQDVHDLPLAAAETWKTIRAHESLLKI